MYARRFLMVIAFLTFLVVGAGIAIFQFGDRIIARMSVPTMAFAAPTAASAPDYALAENWLARPDLPNDPSRWRPKGLAADGPGAAAIFYVHPTTYLENDRWNAPLTPEGDAGKRLPLFVAGQASAFNGSGAVWAPRYRQAVFGAFLTDKADAAKAIDLAYDDVAAAFDAFLTANPEGPIFLAGHSQGSLHLLHLLSERGEALKDRIVATYIVGWPVDAVADLPATGLGVCAKPDQTACLMSWQSFAEPANPHLVVNAWAGDPGLAGGTRSQANMICTNPLTGGAPGTAQPSANPGLLMPSADLSGATLAPGLVGARCHDGFLLLNGAIPNLGPYVLPGNNYHVYDYALFWGAVRQDAARRLAAWTR